MEIGKGILGEALNLFLLRRQIISIIFMIQQRTEKKANQILQNITGT